MARSTKKKLAIFVGMTECLIYAEAKYCASEMPGEIKYYECSRTEYCCGIGCCVSPELHFHHLWYYWILVIIMFLVCSGGGWWYRYWLQGRYRAAASAIPNRGSGTRGGQNGLRGAACQGQRARISYNPGRNTVLLHRMRKGPQRNGVAPPFGGGSAATSATYPNTSVVLNDSSCPYYQLYGPPPSYETVIAQSRGKMSNPASPDSTNGIAQTSVQPAASVGGNSIVSQCYSYACNSSGRLNGGLAEPSGQLATLNAGPAASSSHSEAGLAPGTALPFTHFSRYCPVADGPIMPDVCIPFAYPGQSFVPRASFDRMYRAGSTADGPRAYVPYNPYGSCANESSSGADTPSEKYRGTSAERFGMAKLECTASGSKPLGACWQTEDRSIPQLYQDYAAENREGTRSSDSKSRSSDESSLDFESAKKRRATGGSLRAAGRYAGGYAGKQRDGEEESSPRGGLLSKIFPHSCDGLIDTEAASSSRDRGDASPSSFQSNPSSNVILECFAGSGASSSTEKLAKLERDDRSPVENDVSTNSEGESKQSRLDRSKSLD